MGEPRRSLPKRSAVDWRRHAASLPRFAEGLETRASAGRRHPGGGPAMWAPKPRRPGGVSHSAAVCFPVVLTGGSLAWLNWQSPRFVSGWLRVRLPPPAPGSAGSMECKLRGMPAMRCADHAVRRLRGMPEGRACRLGRRCHRHRDRSRVAHDDWQDSSSGEIPKRSKGTDCKSVATGFAGSNPALPTMGSTAPVAGRARRSGGGGWFSGSRALGVGRRDARCAMGALERAPGASSARTFAPGLRDALKCGCSSMVERQPSKLAVEGSIPFTRSSPKEFASRATALLRSGPRTESILRPFAARLRG